VSPAGAVPVEPDQIGAGPVVPSRGGAAVLRPVPFRLAGGFWPRRQRVNSRRSIPHGLEQLRRYGQWDDFRRAADRVAGTHTGRPYTDSDVYKMAEALAWDLQHCTAGADASTVDTRRPAVGDDRSTMDGEGALAEIATLVADAQEDTGYLNTWFQSTGTAHFSDPQMGHELYCAGHLLQAAVAAARSGTGAGLLAVARRFADHLVDRSATSAGAGLCGHAEIEMALVELYRLTGHPPYLSLARRLIDLRGYGHLGPGHYGAAYYQDDTPIREARELDGHCVRALYLAAGATDVYLETGDPTLLAALRRLWGHTLATKTYLTGGVGCRRKTEAFGAAYELPPDQAFNETCAGVASVMWSWRLLLATGESGYADHIERVLFNVVAAGVGLSGDRFSYINTLHRRATAMEHGDKAPYRKAWFGCACCPPNLMRILASLDHYVATTDADGVQLHQYGAGTVHTDPVDLAVHTDYPWGGRIAVAVTAARSPESTLRLRVPGWCARATLELNGVPVDTEPSRGYLSLRRRWRPGDRIVLDLTMPPRITWPHPDIDAVRGCVAIERGPLVYCVEGADLPSGAHLDALRLDTGAPVRAVARPDLLGGVVTVQATARDHTDGAAPPWPYGTRAPTAGAEPGTKPGGQPSTGAGVEAGTGAGESVGGPAGGGTPVTVTAIPYYAWDNRDRGMMRVWLPATG
jgi:hypothetical protein